VPVLATEVAPSSEPYQRARRRIGSLLAEVRHVIRAHVELIATEA
jgi:hypothetical protein